MDRREGGKWKGVRRRSRMREAKPEIFREMREGGEDEGGGR